MLDVVVTGLKQAQERVQNAGKQVRFATSVAMNRAAYKSLSDIQREVNDSFDRPTPWIQRSARYTKATKTNLEVTFGYDVWGNKQGVTASKVLNAEVKGGSRNLKRFEVALRRKGYLPEGYYAVPGQAAKELGMMDAYGNMKGGAIVQILSKLQAFQETGFSANVAGRRQSKAGRGRVYWVGKPGRRTPLGIWLIDEKHSGRGRLRPIMIFVRNVHYEKRYDFHFAAKTALLKHFDQEFPAALQQALAAAR